MRFGRRRVNVNLKEVPSSGVDVGSRIRGDVVFSVCGSTSMMIYDIKVLFRGVERNIKTKKERYIVSLEGEVRRPIDGVPLSRGDHVFPFVLQLPSDNLPGTLGSTKEGSAGGFVVEYFLDVRYSHRQGSNIVWDASIPQCQLTLDQVHRPTPRRGSP